MIKQRTKVFLLVFILVFVWSGVLLGQETPKEEIVKIKTIRENISQYKDEKVTLEGFVTQYLEDTTQTTDFYFLKDYWGGIIKVRTSQPLPEVGKRYRVIGVVDQDIVTEDIFISEESRVQLSVETPPPPKGFLAWLKKNWPYLAVGVGALILVLLIIVLIYALKEKKEMTTKMAVTPIPGEAIPESKVEEKKEIPEPEEVLEGSTIKMSVPPPGTLKLLPAKFVVLEGDEKIKEIRFYKEPGKTEAEITFGRAAGPNYSHVQLKPLTVSAKHAKLIYSGDKFILINYSRTNPTKVNGVDLPENGSTELKDGDKIEMGEMVFEFKLTK